MGAFIKGAVLVVPYPFSDREGAKRRPVLVLASLPGDDIIVCQITSQAGGGQHAVPITDADFLSGSLQRPSFARPDHLFTISSQRVAYQIGLLAPAKVDEIIAKLMAVLST